MERRSRADAMNRAPAAAIAAAFLFAWPLLAAPSALGALGAHEEAVIESPQSSVPAGGTLSLAGKDFTAGESYALRLVGALREYELGEVEPSDAGTFTLELEIPGHVVSGAYRLVAVAEDGDEVARMDLQVLAPNPSAAAEGGADSGGAHGAAAGGGARADDIRIERDRSGLEWGAIGLLVGLAGGFGIGLLKRTDADG